MFKLNKTTSLGIKEGHEYFQDINGIIFCDPIDQSNMIGGGHEEGRNTLENPTRLSRIFDLTKGMTAPSILDYGCGNGMLVQYLKENGLPAMGYDKFNPKFNESPVFNSINLVTMVEVIEHLHEPFSEIDHIFNLLIEGGKIMIETSFSDWLTLKDAYINPYAGHHCVWSHRGLIEMMESKGFKQGEHINRNVLVFLK
jgi:SAM-dependent methyltransferase